MDEDDVPRCVPLPSSKIFARCGGTQEAGSTVTESLVAIYHVGAILTRRRRREARSSTSQESAEPVYVRIKGANQKILWEKLMSDHGRFSSYEGLQGVANIDVSWDVFRDAQGFGRQDAGSSAGFTSSRPPPT